MNANANKKRWIVVAIILAVAFCGLVMINTSPVTAKGQSVNNVEKSSDGAELSADNTYSTTMLPSMAKMISALVVVIFCIYLGLSLLKRMMRGSKAKGGHLLEVIETAYVAPKKTVSLIRVADKSVLIGVTDSQISILTELSAEQTAELMTRPVEKSAEADAFGRLLQTAVGKLKQIGNPGGKAALEA